jgi:hypothetical protein
MEFDFEIIRSATHAGIETPTLSHVWIGRWRSAELVHVACV